MWDKYTILELETLSNSLGLFLLDRLIVGAVEQVELLQRLIHDIDREVKVRGG